MTANTEIKLNNSEHVEPKNVNIGLDDLDEKGKVDSSFREKLCNVFRNITVEPCVLLLIIGATINNIASQNLQLEKACRVNLNFSTEICDSLRIQNVEQDNDYERETQQLLADILAFKTYLTALLPCILALFVGSFSDKTGHRKIFLIISATGQMLMSINNIFHVYFLYGTTLEATVFSEAFIEGSTGGWCICFLTAFAYISAITTNTDRTFRIGIVSFCITIGLPIGTALSGILLKALGFYGVYGICISLNLMNALYTIFMVKDPKRSPEQKAHDGQNYCYLLRTFFHVSNVKDTVSVVFRKAPNNRRLRLCILLLAVIFLFGPMYGEMAIMYLTVRYRFSWDEVQYSIFQTYNLIINSIGMTFSIVVFAKYLGWHDSLLGIMSSFSKIAASFVYCFALTGAIFYLGPLVDILNMTSLVAMRSLISKIVEAHELGKLSSVVGIFENLSPLIYVPTYLKVYSATMEVLPGAVFLLGALLMFPAIAVLCYLFYEHRKQVRKLQSSQGQGQDVFIKA